MAYKIKEAPPKSGIIDETDLLSKKDRFLLFVEQNRTAILVGIVLTIVVAVALGGLIWLEKLKNEEALWLEGKAQLLFYNRPTDKPEQTQENLSEAIELYRQILEEFPQTSSARRALFFLGNALMEQNDLKGATETYERFVQQYPDDGILLGIVYQRLSYAHLLNGDQKRAYEVLTKILELPNAINKDQVLYEFAKLEEAEGNTQGALAHYKQLIVQYPHSPFFKEASLRVKILEPEEAPPTKKEETEEKDSSEKVPEGKQSPPEDSQEESLSEEK